MNNRSKSWQWKAFNVCSVSRRRRESTQGKFPSVAALEPLLIAPSTCTSAVRHNGPRRGSEIEADHETVLTYNLGLTFVKVSVVFQYQRIFTVRSMRIPFQLAMGLCVAWVGNFHLSCTAASLTLWLQCITWFFAGIFACRPVTAYWRLAEKPTAKCIPDEAYV